MKLIRKYISLCMLALLLFPIGEKVWHDVEHFSDDSCEIEYTHYCKAEHSCFFCDYVLSSSSYPPVTHKKTLVFWQLVIIVCSLIIVDAVIRPKFTFRLRGPPVV